MAAVAAWQAGPRAETAAEGGAPVELRGSPAAMAEQHRVAQEHGLSFFETAADIEAAVQRGELAPMAGNGVYEVADFVVPPYVHRDVLPFIERTARLYQDHCDEPLVVTSGVRALADQPPNAHALSVHPAGMAVDFRVSQTPDCIEWFETKLLALEEIGLVNAIRERNPPHYHVAVYPQPYLAYVQANPLPEQTAPVPWPEPGDVGGGGGTWLIVFAVLLLLGAGAVLSSRRRDRGGADHP